MDNLKLSIFNDNKDEIITLISQKLSSEQQKLFVLSFYEYLKHRNNKFVIDVWKQLGYSKKDKFTNMLEKDFENNIDFKISEDSSQEVLLNKNIKQNFSNENRGGSNKKKIYLTVKCFKQVCMKAKPEYREYYIIMEETWMEYFENKIIEIQNNKDKETQKLIEDVKRDINFKNNIIR